MPPRNLRRRDYGKSLVLECMTDFTVIISYGKSCQDDADRARGVEYVGRSLTFGVLLSTVLPALSCLSLYAALLDRVVPGAKAQLPASAGGSTPPRPTIYVRTPPVIKTLPSISKPQPSSLLLISSLSFSLSLSLYLSLYPFPPTAIMPYSDVDKLAINTIRLLAVSTST